MTNIKSPTYLHLLKRKKSRIYYKWVGDLLYSTCSFRWRIKTVTDVTVPLWNFRFHLELESKSVPVVLPHDRSGCGCEGREVVRLGPRGDTVVPCKLKVGPGVVVVTGVTRISFVVFGIFRWKCVTEGFGLFYRRCYWKNDPETRKKESIFSVLHFKQYLWQITHRPGLRSIRELLKGSLLIYLLRI